MQLNRQWTRMNANENREAEAFSDRGIAITKK
jgi:hypothetical protein